MTHNEMWRTIRHVAHSTTPKMVERDRLDVAMTNLAVVMMTIGSSESDVLSVVKQIGKILNPNGDDNS